MSIGFTVNLRKMAFRCRSEFALVLLLLFLIPLQVLAKPSGDFVTEISKTLERRIYNLQNTLETLKNISDETFKKPKKEDVIHAFQTCLGTSNDFQMHLASIGDINIDASHVERIQFHLQKLRNSIQVLLDFKNKLPDDTDNRIQNALNWPKYYFDEVTQHQTDLYVPLRVWAAFEVKAGDYQGSYVSSEGHFLSTLHWSGVVLPESLKIPVEFESTNKLCRTAYRMKETGPIPLPKKPYGFGEISFMGRGYFPHCVPLSASIENLPVFDDFLVTKNSTDKSHPCLPLGAKPPDEGKMVFLLTHRGAIPGHFYDSKTSFEALTGEVQNPDHRIRAGWIGQITDLELYYWVDGPFEHGDSSGTLVNEQGELLGTISSVIEYSSQNLKKRVFANVVSAQEIRRTAIAHLGEEAASKLFDCKL